MVKRKEYSKEQKRRREATVRLASVALLIALQVVLSRFLSINLQFLKIGFSFVPLMVAGYLYGATGGVTVATISDLIGALLFPSGPFFPGFTATAALSGLIYGAALGGKCTTVRIAVGVFIEQVVCGLLLNTMWLTFLYNSSFKVLILTRIWQIIAMIFVEFIFAEIFFKRLSFIEKLKKQLSIYK